jgi:hypothetical protein
MEGIPEETASLPPTPKVEATAFLATTAATAATTAATSLVVYAPKPRSGYCGYGKEDEEERFEAVLQSTGIDELRKNAIRRRFLRLLFEFRDRCYRFSVLYHIGHMIITVGSLIVPALLSVQYNQSSSESFQIQVYWCTWVLSLLVTTFNGILVLFKVDKKYHFLHTTLERLRSEGWQYLELTGRYSGVLTNYVVPPTHDNQYRFFCHYVEKIKLKQIEEEYYKYEDTNANGVHPTQSADTAATTKPSESKETPLFPPSIDKTLATMLPSPSMKDAINTLVLQQQQPQQSQQSQQSQESVAPKNIVVSE